MLKSQLLAEAKNINATVELDGIFESVELSDEVKANFSTVFEQTVKAKAVELAESHINDIAVKAEVMVNELVEAAKTENAAELMENADKFLSHIAKEWLAENTIAVDNGIKARLCENMIVGLKELFVEHNVIVPEDEIDVVAELEAEIAESKQELSSLFDKNVALTEQLQELNKSTELKEATADLTESQREKVLTLVEGLDYNDAFAGKVKAIVEMTKLAEKPAKSTDININESEAAGVDYNAVEELKEETKTDPSMAQYLNASRRLV